jgi:hypothetical protein
MLAQTPLPFVPTAEDERKKLLPDPKSLGDNLN